MDTENIVDLRDTAPLQCHDQIQDLCNDSVDQLLQAVLLQAGLLEDQSPEDTQIDTLAAATSRMPLRELRQTGRLRELSHEAQTTLLGGTLCRYSSEASPMPPVEIRHAALTTTLNSHRSLSATLERQRIAPGLALSSTRPILGGTAADLPSLGRSLRRLVGVHEEASETSDSNMRTISALEQELHDAVDVVANQDDVSDEETLLAASLAQGGDTSGGQTWERHTPIAHPGIFQEAEHSTIIEEFGDTTMSLQQLDHTIFSESSSMGGTLTPEGGIDGGLIDVLRRLALGASLDEVLLRSVNRVFQLGTLLADQRLSDTEIRELPKVRFESAEEQACAICLEAYQPDELLTALPCSHFFHVDCLAKWLQRSHQCPLCRGPPKREDSD